jgi:hypothetical protein
MCSELSFRPAAMFRRSIGATQPPILSRRRCYQTHPRSPAALNQQAGGRGWRRWLIGSAALAVGAGLIVVARTGRATGDFEAFWQPVFSQQGPVLVGLAHPLVYHPSSRLLSLDEEQNGANGVAQRPIHVTASLQPDDYVPAVDQYVGFGDAVAAARLALLFTQHGRDSKLRLASKVEFADLRDSSSVLIGAFTNRWTIELARTLRYRFEGRKRKPAILNASTGQEWILWCAAREPSASHRPGVPKSRHDARGFWLYRFDLAAPRRNQTPTCACRRCSNRTVWIGQPLDHLVPAHASTCCSGGLRNDHSRTAGGFGASGPSDGIAGTQAALGVDVDGIIALPFCSATRSLCISGF